MRLWPARRPTITLGTRVHGVPLWNERLNIYTNNYMHFHCIGLTKSGKSGFITSQLLQMIERGIGFSFMDPHSDTAEQLLALLLQRGFFEQPGAMDRFLYIEFSEDEDYIFPFNVLKQPGISAHNIALQVLEACHRAWPALSGGAAPSFDTTVLGATKVLTANGMPLSVLPRFLTDKPFRDGLLAKETDENIVSFFHDYIDRLSGREALDTIQSTMRRLFLLTFNPALRYSLSHPENGFQPRRFMDEQLAVVYNLGKIRDAETRALLGGLLHKGYEDAAFTREELPPSARPVHYLIVDEFAEFSANTEASLSRTLSETRKYGLFCGMAHQTFSQTSKRLQGALSNAELAIAFRTSREDAEILAKRFFDVDPQRVKSEALTEKSQPVFMQLNEQWEVAVQALTNQRPRHAWVKLAGYPPVQMKTLTLPPITVEPGALEQIKRAYRERLMRRKDEIVLPERPSKPAPKVKRTVRADSKTGS